MKVVLFCGGLGMRMREGEQTTPKPMVPIGSRPLLWNVMRYYAHFGHTEFILCLGYGGQVIKDYFLDYSETASNDFVLRDGGQVDLLSRDMDDWTITFVNTGLQTSIGERLLRVRKHLAGEPLFLANYADVLTDAPLDDMIAKLEASDATASMLAVRPQAAFHVVTVADDERVSDIASVDSLPMRENGGYFVFRQEILDDLHEGEDLVGHTLARQADRGKLLAYRYDGFWMPADTFKERFALESMSANGVRPWALWEPEGLQSGEDWIGADRRSRDRRFRQSARANER